MTVRAIGHTPHIVNVTRQPDDERIDFEVNLAERPVQLQDVVATARRPPDLDAFERPTPGETSTNISGEQALRRLSPLRGGSPPPARRRAPR